MDALRPQYVFVTSKSSAGKSFFSRRLVGYKVLELDELVRRMARISGMEEKEAFQVYKNSLAEPVTAAFVTEIHEFFERHAGSPVVVEGAIADADLVRRVFSGPYAEFTFVYLYPVDTDAYVERMMKRFKEDKKNGTRRLAIWPQVTPEIKEAACDSPELKQFMLRMAAWSMAKAAQRYDHFEKNGLEMIRVDV